MNRNRKKAVAASLAAGMAAVMAVTPVMAADSNISKEETVYVNAAADGTPEEITVSDWLKNSASAGDLSDTSDLKDIKNRTETNLPGIQITRIFIIRVHPIKNFRFP